MKKGAIVTGLAVTVALAVGVAGLYYFGQKKMIADSVNQYSAAKSLYDGSQWPEAQHLFSEVLRKYPHSDKAAESAFYVAVILQADGKYAEALERWKSLPRSGGSAREAEIDYYIALCLEKLEKIDEAKAQYETLGSSGAGGAYVSLAKASLGRIAEEAGDLDGALALYEEALSAADDSGKEIGLAERLLGELNLRMYYMPAVDEYKEVYLIKPGDSMVAIALRNHVTVDQLCKLNDISNPTRIRPNMRILIPKPDFSIHIDKSDFKLTLFNHDRFFKAYKVGLGKNSRTPAAEYEVSDKIKNPVWWSPNGPIPAGDPNNELGTRWLAMRPLTPGIGPDYGIHGTIDPSTIGWESSNGCPRMYPAEVEELYMLVPIGTPVVVEP